jgi:hypothetical protein
MAHGGGESLESHRSHSFFFKKKKKKEKREDILEINTCVYVTVLKILYKKNARTMHVSQFSSKKMKMVNGVLTLKNLKTLLEYF